MVREEIKSGIQVHVDCGHDDGRERKTKDGGCSSHDEEETDQPSVKRGGG
jgi:hypothetical protein